MSSSTQHASSNLAVSTDRIFDMMISIANIKYKDFGEIWGYAQVEKDVNAFLEQHSGIEIIMFERTGGNGLYGAHMFYRLPADFITPLKGQLTCHDLDSAS